jgi:hypothetical protein
MSDMVATIISIGAVLDDIVISVMHRIEVVNELPWDSTNQIHRKIPTDRARSLEAAHSWSA